VARKIPSKRISAAVDALRRTADPVERLVLVRDLQEASHELETTTVDAARRAGVTWAEIGAVYGLTKQGAQQRFKAER
jgi:hypothetical protein